MGLNIKSAQGQSSVHLPHTIPKNPNTGVSIVSGKNIVMKPLNTHNANPGFKKGK